MKYLPLATFVLLLIFGSCPALAQGSGQKSSDINSPGQKASDDKCYELRVYTSPEGKLDNLNRRFRTYTRRIFAKYDMQSLGYWTPLENPSNELYYVLSYPNCTARDSSWARFQQDPEWRRVKQITEAGGGIVSKVEETFLKAADFSPTIGPWAVEHPRVFELRIYYPMPGKLQNVLDRFRNHTMRLFQKHGLTNIAYWVPTSGDTERLIYLIAFPDEFSRDESFQNFIADPEWQAAHAASVRDGEIVKRIDSVMLVPTDYSPMR